MCKDTGVTLQCLNVHGHLQLRNKTNFDNTVEEHSSHLQSVSFLPCSWQFRAIFWPLSSNATQLSGLCSNDGQEPWGLSCLAKHSARAVRGEHQFLKWPFKISSIQHCATLYSSCCMYFRKKTTEKPPQTLITFLNKKPEQHTLLCSHALHSCLNSRLNHCCISA